MLLLSLKLGSFQFFNQYHNLQPESFCLLNHKPHNSFKMFPPLPNCPGFFLPPPQPQNTDAVLGHLPLFTSPSSTEPGYPCLSCATPSMDCHISLGGCQDRDRGTGSDVVSLLITWKMIWQILENRVYQYVLQPGTCTPGFKASRILAHVNQETGSKQLP